MWDLLQNVTAGIALVSISVLIQVTVTLLVLRLFACALRFVEPHPTYRRQVFVLTGLILIIILDHLLQIHIWGSAFYLLSYFDDFWAAQYFASQTYTTLGYGDLLLPPVRRMLSGWLALTGLLMIGWSTALFVYLITQYFETHRAADRRGNDQRPSAPLPRQP